MMQIDTQGSTKPMTFGCAERVSMLFVLLYCIRKHRETQKVSYFAFILTRILRTRMTPRIRCFDPLFYRVGTVL